MDQNAISVETNKVITNYYLCLFDVLKKANINPDIYLKKENIPLNLTDLKKHSHSLEQFYRIIKDILTSSEISGLGLEFGRLMKLSDYGILGYAILSSQNVMQALKYLCKFISMTTNQVCVSLKLEDTIAILRFEEQQSQYWPQPFLLEECLAESWTVFKFLLPELNREHPLKINLSYAKPSYFSLYKEVFQCPANYNQDNTELCFPRRWLELPINTSNEIATKVCAQQCELIVNQLSEQGNIVDKTRRLILSQPMSPPLSLEDAADKLLLSSRTLRERLYQAGTSYKEVTNELRMKIAMEYLSASDLTTQEIAYIVGYQHSANFFRAFKKSMGLTPEQYKMKKLSN